MKWYVARLLVVCLVDRRPRRQNTCDYPFVLVRADSAEQAFERALELGRAQETRYLNAQGQSVRWAFVRVEEIRTCEPHVEGTELGSLLTVLDSDHPLRFDTEFRPRSTRPLFT